GVHLRGAGSLCGRGWVGGAHTNGHAAGDSSSKNPRAICEQNNNGGSGGLRGRRSRRYFRRSRPPCSGWAFSSGTDEQNRNTKLTRRDMLQLVAAPRRRIVSMCSGV